MSHIPIGGAVQLLFTGGPFDMAVADADNALTKVFLGTNFAVTDVYAKRVTGGTSVACAGGIYTATSKGGLALVAAVQSWVTLTGAGKMVRATLANLLGTDLSSSAVAYLNLTGASTGGCTATFYVYGVVLD